MEEPCCTGTKSECWNEGHPAEEVGCLEGGDGGTEETATVVAEEAGQGRAAPDAEGVNVLAEDLYLAKATDGETFGQRQVPNPATEEVLDGLYRGGLVESLRRGRGPACPFPERRSLCVAPSRLVDRSDCREEHCSPVDAHALLGRPAQDQWEGVSDCCRRPR